MRSIFYRSLFLPVLTLVSPSFAAENNIDPRRPAAIQTEEVPSVPPEVFTRLAQYQNVRSAAFEGWAPDGSGILIGTRFGNSIQLHRVYQPGGRREQITFFDEPVTGSFLPEASDGSLVLSMDTGGNENAQIYWFDIRNHDVALITDGKSRHGLGPALPGGTKMIVSSNSRNTRDMDLYIVDPRRPNSMELLFEAKGQTWQAADWSRDGRTVLLVRYVSANESYPALLDVESRELTSIKLPADGPAAVSTLQFSPDGKAVYLSTDADSEFLRLARYDIETESYEWLTDDIEWDVRDLVVEPQSGDVALAINADGASRVFYLPRGRGPRQELQVPLGIVASLAFSPDGKQLGFTLARPDAPADAYSLDLTTSSLTRWTYSEVGGLDPTKFVTPSRIQFPAFDDRDIPAYYFRPDQAAANHKVPVLISIHGGPESQYRPFFSGQTQFYVNELGIAVIYPNVRGSSGYGKTYLKLDNAELREDSVRDIGGLLDWIENQVELDASRVGVVGGSYGGYMVLASLVHHGDRIRAGVDIVGIANFLTFLDRTASYRVDLRRAEYGDERDPMMRAVFEKISPLNHADKIRSALMVVHGKNDPRVPFFEAQQIAEKVRQNGRPVWTVFAENEGHGFAKKNNSDYARAVEVMFLKEHLGL